MAAFLAPISIDIFSYLFKSHCCLDQSESKSIIYFWTQAFDRWTLIFPCLPRGYVFSGLVTMWGLYLCVRCLSIVNKFPLKPLVNLNQNWTGSSLRVSAFKIMFD